MVSEAEAAYGPEGLTISPDGTRVLTNNIEFSANAEGDPLRTEHNSLSLFTLDPATGAVAHPDTVYDDAVLTESAVVDTTGTWVATDRNSRGPELVAAEYSTALPRGPHTMVLVP